MTQIRGVFPLPQTSPQIAGVVPVVTLPSGGVYVLPAGNYLVIVGSRSLLQWFDPVGAQWLQSSFTGTSPTPITSDGTNYRILNATGVVQGAAITAAGSGGTNGIGPIQTGTAVGFSASPTGQTAEGYAIIGGSVPAPTVVQGGSGFLVPPVVCCDPPPVGGIQATFVATISTAGVITTVTQVNPGAGYTSVPQFYVIPQPKFYEGMPRWPGDAPVTPPWPAPGSINPANVWPGTIYQANIAQNGALLTGNPLTGSGTLTGINLVYGGGGYPTATPPTISFVGGTLTGATASANAPIALANDTSWLQAKVG
jgi:hypothetical protein